MKAVGRNIALSFLLVFELFFCAYSLIETWDSDKNPREFECVGIQITEIAADDPIVKKIGYMELDRYHHYLVKLQIKNRYAEALNPFLLHAKNEDGELLVCTQVDYYDHEAIGTYLLREVIPAGTEGQMSYIVSIGNYCYEETDMMRLHEHGKEKEYIEIAIPKE